jgi:hypothetical protein
MYYIPLYFGWYYFPNDWWNTNPYWDVSDDMDTVGDSYGPMYINGKAESDHPPI